MNEAEIKAEIKRIVAWQFDRLTNLGQEAYNNSLDIIAEQLFTLMKKGLLGNRENRRVKDGIHRNEMP